MYRKLLLASAAAVALSGTAALAADLPSRAPPPAYIPPPPIFSWTGIYVGGQVGYGWGTGNFNRNLIIPGGPALSGTLGQNPNGVIGGAHVGYQYQINQWVLGIEGSVDGTSLSADSAAAFPNTPVGPVILTASSNADIQGSIRGKLGIAWDRVLIYATGGVAFGGFNSDINISAPNVPFFATANRSTTKVGWTVGGGLQYAVTNNWWVFAEYRFTDFGNLNNNDIAGLPAGWLFNGNRKLQQNQVQVGFSYKFDLGAPPPVVAKY